MCACVCAYMCVLVRMCHMGKKTRPNVLVIGVFGVGFGVGFGVPWGDHLYIVT